MKNLFKDLDSSEKKRILELHMSATRRHYISEQVKQGGANDQYQYKKEGDKYFYAKKGEENWFEAKNPKSLEAIKTRVFGENPSSPTSTVAPATGAPTTQTQSTAKPVQQGGDTISQSYQKGFASGEATGKNVQEQIKRFFKNAQEVVIRIGKSYIKCIIFEGVVLYLTAKGVYKISSEVFNALVKFISSTGKAIINKGTQVAMETINFLSEKWTGFKDVISKGVQQAKQWITSLKDNTVAIVKSVINSFTQFGVVTWGKILVMASTVNEFGEEIKTYLKQEYDKIAQKVGATWDQAIGVVKQGFQSAKQKVGQIAQSAVQTGNEFIKSLAGAAGQATGFVSGVFESSEEFYVRYSSFSSNETLGILTESIKYNNKSILL